MRSEDLVLRASAPGEAAHSAKAEGDHSSFNL